MLGSAPDGFLVPRRVSNRVNEATNDGPDLIEPGD